MKKIANSEYGAVQVHNNVLGQIVQSAIVEVEGVTLIEKPWSYKFLEYFGQTSNPAVEVKVNEKEEVTLDVKICVRYGLNVPDVARQVQEVIKKAIDKTVDINLIQININIQGIERGEQK